MKRLRDLLEMVLEMTQTNMLLITSVQYKNRYHIALCTIVTIPRWSDFYQPRSGRSSGGVSLVLFFLFLAGRLVKNGIFCLLSLFFL